LWNGRRYNHERLRIAYLSADFHEHATSYLMAGLFEHHDRSSFETIGVSFGPPDASAMRTRLTQALERFIDVSESDDETVAKLLCDLEVDIAVDLKGFTTGARPGILAFRPAPLQVNYLGYPGTMAADYIDYILADRTVISEHHRRCYWERVAYLPDSYQANDNRRHIDPTTPARHEVGLPEHGFVFCSFNSGYKITPVMFDVWMRLLRAVEGSVLWLIEGDPAAARNLREEARRRGISPDRLVFAPVVPLSAHLARHRLADLFLDTLPCNAHTTASDALWAGLPIVTCMGETFAGRVCASLLRAVGMPELIAESLPHYEQLAVNLALEPDRLLSVRRRLQESLTTTPLFDTARITRHIERAYRAMWERHQRGEPPADFDA
jgi:predicted O-linked N-acetylglucosamine transferase (SPINDLY family)